MAREEDVTPVFRGGNVHARLGGFAQNLELRHPLQIGPARLRVARVRGEKDVVKTAQKMLVGKQDLVLKDAEHLPRQRVFRNAEMVEQAGLRAPADVQGGGDVLLCPVHDLAQFPPVGDLLKLQLFHRRTGDDEAVELQVLDLVETHVVHRHVLFVGVPRLVCERLEEGHLHLQRRVSKQSKQLGLGRDLGWHQVQDCQPNRPDVLPERPVLTHDEDVLLLQGGTGGKRTRDFDWHAL